MWHDQYGRRAAAVGQGEVSTLAVRGVEEPQAARAAQAGAATGTITTTATTTAASRACHRPRKEEEEAAAAAAVIRTRMIIGGGRWMSLGVATAVPRVGWWWHC